MVIAALMNASHANKLAEALRALAGFVNGEVESLEGVSAACRKFYETMKGKEA